ncbi:MAG: NlpC/P60 family protein [Bacteroidales bacterium]
MESGIISKSLAAIRKEPHETSEMVNQMIFGETFDIVENYKGWLRIISHFDQYHGWLDSRLSSIISENRSSNFRIASTLFKAKEDNSEFPINLCPGTVLTDYIDGTFSCGNSKLHQLDNPFEDFSGNQADTIVQMAKRYINSPYLWGGRSPYGIDCSGLVQVVYRIADISLPRDASQQATAGSTVEFIDHVKTGDLAFFDNEEGAITHVGIISNKEQIIHSSGFVRVDKFDHQGIFNVNTKQYSHKLRVIKRVF